MLKQLFRIALSVMACLPLLAGAASDPATAPSVTVFAAASLSDVLQELGDLYTRQSGITVVYSFAATSILARQLENGAHADLFFSADQEWMDYVDQRGLIQRPSRHNLLGNRLALVAGVDSTIQLQIAPRFALLAALHGERLAVADPDAVPAGRYARSALLSLGVWNDVADHLVRAENVRGALLFVARGEVPLGIVYQTDALVDHHVRIVGLFPEDTHLPIIYPIALTSTAGDKARAFVEYLGGPAAQVAFKKYGFSVLQK